MFARLAAKAVLAIIGVALVFFGVGLIGFGIAAALSRHVGPGWGNTIAGAIFLLPPLIWALALISSAPRRNNRGGAGVLMALVGALARETPLMAMAGAALASAAELFLNRNKAKK